MSSSPSTPPRVRIAPSPTGDPHIGTAYIALFNYVFAKKHGGTFLLRIEDTDQARYRKQSETQILAALKWFGLTWTEGPDVGGKFGPYRQSERLPYYKDHAKKLIELGHAYRCFCTVERLEQLRTQQTAQKLPPGYDRHCRKLPVADGEARAAKGDKHTIRFKVPLDGKTIFKDELRGNVEFENSKLDDLVLLKADGFPTYHLASVVDDHLMEITHIIRGEEWLSSTPKHVLLYAAFGWTPPAFIHLNLIRNPDKSKISKRKNPTNITYYQRKGILPQTMRNFLALMGWSLGGDQEKFTTDEMIQHFTWDRFSLGGPVFDLKKMLWLNGKYLRELSDDEWLKNLKDVVLSDDYLKAILPLVKDRVEAYEEFIPATDFFFSGDLDYTGKPLLPAGRTPKEASTWINEILEKLDEMEDWTTESIKTVIEAYLNANQLKTKELYMTIRVAIAGSNVSPGLFETMHVLGKEMTRRRLRLAVQALKAAPIPAQSPQKSVQTPSKPAP